MLVSCKTADVTPHSQLAGQQLSEKDLLNVMEELANVRAKWYNIGLGLGLDVGTLNSIETEHSNNSDCLRETLTTWLKAYPPPPTWSKVVDTLRTKTVGEARLATDLECKYCSSRPVPPIPTIITTPQLVVASATVPPLLQPFPITRDSTPPDTPLSPQPPTVTTQSHPPTPAHIGTAIRILCHSCMVA